MFCPVKLFLIRVGGWVGWLRLRPPAPHGSQGYHVAGGRLRGLQVLCPFVVSCSDPPCPCPREPLPRKAQRQADRSSPPGPSHRRRNVARRLRHGSRRTTTSAPSMTSPPSGGRPASRTPPRSGPRGGSSSTRRRRTGRTCGRRATSRRPPSWSGAGTARSSGTTGRPRSCRATRGTSRRSSRCADRCGCPGAHRL